MTNECITPAAVVNPLPDNDIDFDVFDPDGWYRYLADSFVLTSLSRRAGEAYDREVRILVRWFGMPPFLLTEDAESTENPFRSSLNNQSNPFRGQETQRGGRSPDHPKVRGRPQDGKERSDWQSLPPKIPRTFHRCQSLRNSPASR